MDEGGRVSNCLQRALQGAQIDVFEGALRWKCDLVSTVVHHDDTPNLCLLDLDWTALGQRVDCRARGPGGSAHASAALAAQLLDLSVAERCVAEQLRYLLSEDLFLGQKRYL